MVALQRHLILASDTEFAIWAQPGRSAGCATLRKRFGQMTIKLPHQTSEKAMHNAIPLRLVDPLVVPAKSFDITQI